MNDINALNDYFVERKYKAMLIIYCIKIVYIFGYFWYRYINVNCKK